MIDKKKVEEIKNDIKDNLDLSSDETIEINVVKKESPIDDTTKEIKRISKKHSKYNAPVDVERYQVEPDKGLSLEQVKDRYRHNLTNATKKKYSKSYGEIFFGNIFTFFNLLLICTGIALILVNSFTNIFFLVILFCNTSIGIIQEIKAKNTIDKLRLITAPSANLIRNGQPIELPVDQIVLDDIMLLETGKQISADAIVKEGMIEVNESLLTGESLAVKKECGDMVYAGSFVTSGSAVTQVEKVGSDNYASKLQEKAKQLKKKNSELLNSLNKIIKVISFLIIPLSIFTAIVNFISHDSGKDMIEVIRSTVEQTAGSMIAMIPSGLFLLVSTTLSVSVIKLYRRKAVVHELYSVETLARVNVLCLDKTGTLTDGTMVLDKEIILDPDDKTDYSKIIGGILGTFKESNQTSIALQQKYPAHHDYTINTAIPFSSSRKRSAVSFANRGTYVLGAPEFVLEDHNKHAGLLNKVNKYTLQGYRVLLLAYSDKQIIEDNVPSDLTPRALYIIKDHIRKEAHDTIKWFKDNSVEIKIISGDNHLTVAEIAKQVGVPNAESAISLDGLSLQEVAEIATKYTVFGRVSPEQKAMLVKSLKAAKKTVGMTGDGVNDILALKESDCSIAMASGSEAASNVADLVLLDSNFSSMPKVVEEGRKVINNIQSSACLFLMKTIFAISLTAIILIINIFQVDYQYPFMPKNFYILEFAVIGVPAFFLSLQPNKDLIKGQFIKNVFFKALPGGISILLAAGLILLLQNVPELMIASNDQAISMAIVAFSFVGLLILFHICKPINLYRGILFGIMSAAAFLFLFVLSPVLTGIDYMSFNATNWLLILSVIFICDFVYTNLDRVRERFLS